jgi:16S rRNA (cytosine1402-N4)-methyltransferase
MAAETIRLTVPKPTDVICDTTLGGAGHSLIYAPYLGNSGLLIGIDQDAEALAVASERIKSNYPDLNFYPLHGNFADLDKLLLSLDIPGVDVFLFDPGVSSYQLDTPTRGFSYAHPAPLDMRMDSGNHTPTAAEVINYKTEADLTRILAEYGEERFATRIAAAIVARRQVKPFTMTDDLAEVIRTAIPAAARRTGGNPAKRSFQALRIAVNDELGALQSGLEAALRWLNIEGRIAVLSYHSLEDRIVKQCFAAATQGCTCPPELPICVCGKTSMFELVTKKSLQPSAAECQDNPRSTSARLRVIRRRSWE